MTATLRRLLAEELTGCGVLSRIRSQNYRPIRVHPWIISSVLICGKSRFFYTDVHR
jgi:hypothetical protein